MSRAITDRDIAHASRRGVRPDWFHGDDRTVWEFLVRHHAKFGEVPSAQLVRQNYPAYSVYNVRDGLEAVVDAVVKQHRKRSVVDLLQGSVGQLNADPEDPDAVLDFMRRGLAETDAETPTTNTTDLSQTGDERLARYEQIAAGGGLMGLPTGFPTIDQATAGLQGGQLVTIVASPKTGKSQLALRIAHQIHRAGRTPFFQSFEMGNGEQEQRHDAMAAGISYDRLRRGILTAPEMKRFTDMLKSMDGQPPFILSDSSMGTTIGALSAQVAQHSPDVVFIDGVYLMIDEVTGEANTPQALTNITRGLKRFAQRIDRPVVITTQALLWKMKGNKVTAASIGYSSSYFQDSDVLLVLERPEDDFDGSRVLKVEESRHCGRVRADLVWDWDNAVFEESARDGHAEDDEEEGADEYGVA